MVSDRKMYITASELDWLDNLAKGSDFKLVNVPPNVSGILSHLRVLNRKLQIRRKVAQQMRKQNPSYGRKK